MTSSDRASAIVPTHPAVELEHVSRIYGSFVALRDVSLTLPAGSSVVLLGPNGAGKSTLLKLLAGLARPSYGTVRIFGQEQSASRGRIAYMAHQTMLYDELTGPENLRYLLRLQRPELTAQQVVEHVAGAMRQVGLDPANPRRLGEYSQGMRQRASLAVAMSADPDVLLLDEPFSNLDVGSANAMIARLQAYLREPGTGGVPRTLLLTTHQAQLAQPLARLTLTLREGRLEHVSGPEHPQRTSVGATEVSPIA